MSDRSGDAPVSEGVSLPADPGPPATPQGSRDTAPADGRDEPDRGRDRRIEVIAVFLLGLATVASAWSAYQATLWSGQQANGYSRAGALRSESLRASTRAGQLAQIDVGLFVQWVTATERRDEALATFLRDRFREEFVPAFDAWLAQGPAAGKSLPDGSPFTLPEYRLQASVEAERLEHQATDEFGRATHANKVGDTFVLAAVLFASVLFFSGLESRWDSRRIRVGMLGLAGVLFVIGLVVLALQPQLLP
jgi:hypothetical protein